MAISTIDHDRAFMRERIGNAALDLTPSGVGELKRALDTSLTRWLSSLKARAES